MTSCVTSTIQVNPRVHWLKVLGVTNSVPPIQPGDPLTTWHPLSHNNSTRLLV